MRHRPRRAQSTGTLALISVLGFIGAATATMGDAENHAALCNTLLLETPLRGTDQASVWTTAFESIPGYQQTCLYKNRRGGWTLHLDFWTVDGGKQAAAIFAKEKLSYAWETDAAIGARARMRAGTRSAPMRLSPAYLVLDDSERFVFETRISGNAPAQDKALEFAHAVATNLKDGHLDPDLRAAGVLQDRIVGTNTPKTADASHLNGFHTDLQLPPNIQISETSRETADDGQRINAQWVLSGTSGPNAAAFIKVGLLAKGWQMQSERKALETSGVGESGMGWSAAFTKDTYQLSMHVQDRHAETAAEKSALLVVTQMQHSLQVTSKEIP